MTFTRVVFLRNTHCRRNGTLAHDQVVGIVVCIYTEPLIRGVGNVNVVLKSESLSSDEWWSCSRLLLNVLLIVLLPFFPGAATVQHYLDLW